MKKEVQALVRKVNGVCGLNAIRPAKDLEESMWRIPTGSISLDIATGGGIPTGRMTQISGGFSACKSALLYHILANAQKMHKKKVLWDKYSTKDKPLYHTIICDDNDPDGEPLLCALSQSENHSYSNSWAGEIGVNTEELLFNTPFGMEEGLDIAIALQESGECDIMAHDSYAAYKPIKVIQTEAKDTVRMGIKQQAFDDYHGKYQAHNNKLEREGNIATTLIAINQLREAIGKYGD